MMFSLRNRELFALLLSLLIGALGIYTVSAATLEPPAQIYPFLLAVALSYLLLHLIIRFASPRADPLLLPAAAFLNGIGLAVIYRTRPNLLQFQLIWLGLGVLLAASVVIFWKQVRKLESYKYLTALGGIALLLSPMFLGKEVGGAKLWLSLGRFSLQPAEPAKLLIVIFLAAYLKEKRELLSLSTYKIGGFSIPEPKHLAPLLTMWLLSLLILIFEKDLGSSFLFLAIFLVMIYTATSRFIYAVLGTGLFTLGATMCYYLFAHVRLRVDTWINPWMSIDARGYQITQSLFALASGGISGSGLGWGFPRFIPAVHTDFVFAAVGEELGYVGAIAVLLGYLLFIQRGTAVSLRTAGEFEKLLAFGLTTVFALQSFVIIGGVTKLLPLTGITLPFMSYGGSSLVANFLLLGFLLAVSQGSPGETLSLRLASNLNLAIRKIFLIVLLFFLSILVSLSYWQIWSAKKLQSHPRNVRMLANELTVNRGRILTEDGEMVARSVREKRTFRRLYPQGDTYAHLTGFSSLRYGKSGLEKSQNSWLLGKQDATLQSFFSKEEYPSGNDVVLTIDSRLQKKAREALGSREGAVVVLDPQTGEVRALASHPSFDPNQIGSLWPSLSKREDHPLLNRATQGLYPPGSTFKMVTLAAALDAGLVSAGDLFPGPQHLRVYGGTVTNYGKQDFPQLTLEEAFARSVNTVFAQVALKLGGTRMVRYAERFGLNQKLSLKIAARESSMPPPEAMDKLEVAWAGVGQGRLLVTPFQMALVGAAIANKGVVMRPHLVKEIRSPRGNLIRKETPGVWQKAVDAAAAAEMARLMEKAVTSGTGKAASIAGVRVAGKTGTAETVDKKKTHAWFVGFAPVENPRAAVAVIIERGGTGGKAAAPVAREVLEEALGISQEGKD